MGVALYIVLEDSLADQCRQLRLRLRTCHTVYKVIEKTASCTQVRMIL